MNKNEKFVITINREVGTGGRTVGRKLPRSSVSHQIASRKSRRRRNRGGTISTTTTIRWSTVPVSPWRPR